MVHIRYFSNALKPWIVSRDARTGEGFLILRRDPRDLSRLYVLDPFDGSWLRVPYRTLSRPSTTLREHWAARKRAQECNAVRDDEGANFVSEEMQKIEHTAAQRSQSAHRGRSRPAPNRQTSPAAKSPGTDPAALARVNSKGPPRPFADIEEW
ncbi:Mu transposase C-terminal domain-containing protein [Thalassorhabdomicrobium marinisediminis]|uniref:Mu transposase C-terminal domain-containing protein n=1 Tax=Thalassorhabdomicrobium marinisediminis TaxID=2170577 RepID=UPI001F53E5E8